MSRRSCFRIGSRHGRSERSDELIADLKSVHVEGDRRSRRPSPRFRRCRGQVRPRTPPQLPTEELLAAAGFGLAAFCDLFAENGLAPRGYGPDDSTPRRGGRRRNRE